MNGQGRGRAPRVAEPDSEGPRSAFRLLTRPAFVNCDILRFVNCDATASAPSLQWRIRMKNANYKTIKKECVHNIFTTKYCHGLVTSTRASKIS